MMPNSKPNNKQFPSKKRNSPGKNILLAISLVPMVIGLILIGAWVLDIELVGDLPSQITVGIFFLLLTFTLSNALQKRWKLAIGWGLLAIADIVTLAWLNVAVQVVAILVGLAGLIFLGMEFYRQYQHGKINKHS